MHVFLNERSSDLTGILNGIDDDVWNPKTDKHIFANYTAETIEKKEINKFNLIKQTNIKYVQENR